MTRKESTQKALNAAKKNFCKGCNAFESGLVRGMNIADNCPIPTCVGNVIVQDLTNEQLERFKKETKAAYESCLEELEKRKIY